MQTTQQAPVRRNQTVLFQLGQGDVHAIADGMIEFSGERICTAGQPGGRHQSGERRGYRSCDASAVLIADLPRSSQLPGRVGDLGDDQLGSDQQFFPA